LVKEQEGSQDAELASSSLLLLLLLLAAAGGLAVTGVPAKPKST
jgi:hypothetical protein